MKQTKSNNRISLHSLVGGIGVACIFSLATVFLGAMLICKEYVGEDGVIYFQLITYFLSALLGCFITGRLAETNKVLACSITAIGYLTVLVVVSCLFFDGVTNKIWIGIFCVLGALFASILWISKPQTKNKWRKHKTTRR